VTAIDKEIAALSKAIGEVRRISHDLRPALLDDLGLPAALEHIGNELAQRSGLEGARVAASAGRAAAGAAAVSLFRVAQEALRNVERHARATQIDIRLDDAATGWSCASPTTASASTSRTSSSARTAALA